MSFQILDPTNYTGWDDLLLTSKDYSFFHCSSWAKVLSESYGYTPFYFTLIEGGKLKVLVPVMEVNSFISGKRAISLPFSDYCEPIINGDISPVDLFFEIIKFAKRRKWRYIEFRGGRSFFNHFNLSNTSSYNYLTHKIDLKIGLDSLFKNFKASNRRNIKKAENLGLRVHFSTSWESMEDFCYLNSITRKRHGLPSQPKIFFKNFYEKIIIKNKGIISLAFYNGNPLASYIFCLFGKKAIYKYGASDLRYQSLRANNLLMWESIKWLFNNGFEELSLGRTEPLNHGLCQFKNGWGAVKDYISYFTYNLKKEDFIVRGNEVGNFKKWVLKKLPLPVLNLIGSIFYRHAP